MTGKVLLNNVDADVAAPVEFIESNGGRYLIMVLGDNYGGGTVNIQIRSKNDPGARWTNLTNGSFTEDSGAIMDFIPTGVEIGATFTGSAGASNVFCEVRQ